MAAGTTLICMHSDITRETPQTLKRTLPCHGRFCLDMKSDCKKLSFNAAYILRSNYFQARIHRITEPSVDFRLMTNPELQEYNGPSPPNATRGHR